MNLQHSQTGSDPKLQVSAKARSLGPTQLVFDISCHGNTSLVRPVLLIQCYQQNHLQAKYVDLDKSRK